MFDYVLRALQYCIQWIIDLVHSAAPELDLSGDIIVGNVFNLSDYFTSDQWALINNWIPLDLVIDLATAYFAIKVSLFLFRWFFKFIPGF